MKSNLIICITVIFVTCACAPKRPGTNSFVRGTYPQSESPSSSNPVRTNLPELDVGDSGTIMDGPQIFKKYNSAVFMVYTSNSSDYPEYQGSGFFISSSGIAVSNYHVFKGTTEGYESIKTIDNSIWKVKEVIEYNEDKDYIVFIVDANGVSFNYLPIASRTPLVGEKIYTIGSPKGLENTFSSGEISQYRGEDLFQISAPIDHGSSGGALINQYGEVVGITSGGYDDSDANLNFAVNINVIKHIFE
jgi:serine protease Do